MIDLIVSVIMVLGAAFMLLGGIGILRMPDVFMRISACTKAATLGVSAILLAVAVFFGNISVASRAVATILFVVLTAPVAAHMIGRSAYLARAALWEGTVTDELRGRYNLKEGILNSSPDPASEAADSSGPSGGRDHPADQHSQ